jgi:hypothetical protein
VDVTYYVALPFVLTDDGVAAGEAVECLSANSPILRAGGASRAGRAMSAQSRSAAARNPATGEFGDAKLIRKFGEVPDDLSAL